MPDINFIRAEIERVRRQVQRLRGEIRQLQHSGVSSVSGEALLDRMLSATRAKRAARTRTFVRSLGCQLEHSASPHTPSLRAGGNRAGER